MSLEYQDPNEPGNITVGNIYVDVDDTLVNEIVVDAQGNKEDEIDDQLAAGVRWIKATYPNHEVIIWTTGGVDHARRWGEAAGLGFAEFADKEPGRVNKNDIVVDDDPEDFLRDASDNLMTPSQFVVYVDHERQR